MVFALFGLFRFPGRLFRLFRFMAIAMGNKVSSQFRLVTRFVAGEGMGERRYERRYERRSEWRRERRHEWRQAQTGVRLC